MLPFREALIYDSGIFNARGREAIKGYALVKIIGWGTEKTEEGS